MPESVFDLPSEHERNIFGQFDAYLKKIERTLNVSVVSRDGSLRLSGSEQGTGWCSP